MKESNKMNRRSFLRSSAMAGALGTIGGGATVLTSCSGEAKDAATTYTPLKEAGTFYVPDLSMDVAKDGKPLRAGVIGCGGRGSGAAFNFLDAGNGLTVVALADVFQERVDELADKLKKDRNIDIPAGKRFVGLDAYKQVVDSDVDVVLIATPPVFRPIQFKYATEKGKHSFLEKPIFVDAVGYRTIMATSKQAEAKGLSVITGTQRHHQRAYIESYKKVMEGLIGEITGGTVYWNGGMLWYRERQKGWTDCEFMIKDWVNWKWLSGDHIVEQHCHNIDVFTWFSGTKPTRAVGVGSRQRRITGDQYDNFSIDFTMDNGVHLHSMCRQISGCANNVSEFIQGTKGSWNSRTMEIKDLSGKLLWKYDHEAEKAAHKQTNPYVLEHVNWVNHIRANKPINQAEEHAISNMASLMGREAAYTGQEIVWNEMANSDLDYTPKDLNLKDKMDMSGFVVAVPGSDSGKK